MCAVKEWRNSQQRFCWESTERFGSWSLSDGAGEKANGEDSSGLETSPLVYLHRGYWQRSCSVCGTNQLFDGRPFGLCQASHSAWESVEASWPGAHEFLLRSFLHISHGVIIYSELQRSYCNLSASNYAIMVRDCACQCYVVLLRDGIHSRNDTLFLLSNGYQSTARCC